MQFTSNLSNMVAPYVVRRFISKPFEVAVDNVAKWVDHISSSSKLIEHRKAYYSILDCPDDQEVQHIRSTDYYR